MSGWQNIATAPKDGGPVWVRGNGIYPDAPKDSSHYYPRWGYWADGRWLTFATDENGYPQQHNIWPLEWFNRNG